MIKVLVVLLRFIIGAVFIFSGFVKANDPWGSVYKFLDYLVAFGAADYIDLASFLVFAVAAVEFCLGVMLFTGIYRKLAPVGLSLLMAIMLPLTLYIAITDAVSDCGCFGDVIIMSNTATFVKNLFITAGLIFLIFYNTKVINYYGVAVQWLIVIASVIYVSVLLFIGYYQQPLLDFSAYKQGTKLIDNTTQEADEYKFIYTNGAEQCEFSIDSLPDDEQWQFVKRVEPAADAPSFNSSLYIEQDGEDITQQLFPSDGRLILLLFPDLGQVEISYTYTINELYDYALQNNIGFVSLAAGNDSTIARWRDLSMAAYDIYTIDDSVLKQIARGNPAIVYIDNGIIRWKGSMQSISFDIIENSDDPLSELTNHFNYNRLRNYTLTYIGFLLLLLVINRTHRLPGINNFLERRYKSFIQDNPIDKSDVKK